MQIIVQNLMTHYRRQGSGKVVLLLHGWADKLETFNELATELAHSYEVVALDLPGFGQTQAPTTAWNLDDYAKFLRAFLDKLGMNDIYVVIGHSNGGALAIRAIASGHLSVEKLILLAASGVRDSESLKRSATKVIAKTGKVASFWLPVATKHKLQKKLYGTIGSDMLVAPHMKETFKMTVRQDIQRDASQLALPTLLIYGDQDKATPVSEVGERLHVLIAGSQLEVIDGADHFVHQAKSEKVNRQILEFLK